MAINTTVNEYGLLSQYFRGMSPNQLRYIFKKVLNITFPAGEIAYHPVAHSLACISPEQSMLLDRYIHNMDRGERERLKSLADSSNILEPDEGICEELWDQI